MFNQSLYKTELIFLLVSMFFLVACGQTPPLAVPATQSEQIPSEPITTPVSTSEVAETQPTSEPTIAPVTTIEPTIALATSEPTASLPPTSEPTATLPPTEETQPTETFIISVQLLQHGNVINMTEPRGQITEIFVNFYTSLSFADGKPATFQDLAVGQVLQITGYLPPQSTFLATEVIILPPEAGAGLFQTETITSTVASVDLAQQLIQLAKPWDEITLADASLRQILPAALSFAHALLKETSYWVVSFRGQAGDEACAFAMATP